MFFKISVLKNRCPQTCNFIKKRLQHRCFPVKLGKFLRTPFLTEYLRWLLLILVITVRIKQVLIIVVIIIIIIIIIII